MRVVLMRSAVAGSREVRREQVMGPNHYCNVAASVGVKRSANGGTDLIGSGHATRGFRSPVGRKYAGLLLHPVHKDAINCTGVSPRLSDTPFVQVKPRGRPALSTQPAVPSPNVSARNLSASATNSFGTIRPASRPSARLLRAAGRRRGRRSGRRRSGPFRRGHPSGRATGRSCRPPAAGRRRPLANPAPSSGRGHPYRKSSGTRGPVVRLRPAPRRRSGRARVRARVRSRTASCRVR